MTVVGLVGRVELSISNNINISVLMTNESDCVTVLLKLDHERALWTIAYVP